MLRAQSASDRLSPFTWQWGAPLEGTKGVPSSRLFRPVCASRRVASRRAGYFMHFTYFAYETHADVKPATIRRIILQERTSRMFPTTTRGGYRAEIAFCPRDRKWFGSPKECLCFRGLLQLQLCRNSELTMILTVYRRTLRQYRNY